MNKWQKIACIAFEVDATRIGREIGEKETTLSEPFPAKWLEKTDFLGIEWRDQ
jgi:hypothetical protein